MQASINVTQQTIIAAICIALNVGLGKVSNLMGLPFTMDTVGTILAAALLRWWVVLAVAIASSLIASLVIHPAFLFYVGTQIVIAIVSLALFRLGMFSTFVKSALAGLIIGISSAVASAPVTAVVFGGVAVPSITALNAVFLASGASLWQSVIQGALIVESLDKIAAGIVVFFLLTRIK